MTQEDKELLLIDLCARLPYDVIVHFHDINVDDYDRQLIGEDVDFIKLDIRNCKPYLRPMSSMTGEDMKKLNQYVGGDRFIFKDGVISVDENFYHEGHLYTDHEDYVDIIDWLNSHHFDYHGLIEKGLAFEAPKDMYKTE